MIRRLLRRLVGRCVCGGRFQKQAIRFPHHAEFSIDRCERCARLR